MFPCFDCALTILKYFCSVQKLVNPQNVSELETFAWAAGNLCRGNPRPPYDMIKPLADPLATAILRTDDVGYPEELCGFLQDAIWALHRLSDTGDHETGFDLSPLAPALARILRNCTTKPGFAKDLMHPALTCFGDLASGTESQVESLVESGFLKSVEALLQNKSVGCLRAAMLLPHAHRTLFLTLVLIGYLNLLLYHSAQFDVKRLGSCSISPVVQAANEMRSSRPCRMRHW